jgi:HSP20 family molecular chaperone IbpA
MAGDLMIEVPVAGYVAPVLEIVNARRSRRTRVSPPLAGPGKIIQLPPRSSWAPAVNVFDTGHAFIVIAELAGVGPDSLRIELDAVRDTVTLRGVRIGILPQITHGAEPFDTVDEEIATGAFEREIALGEPVDTPRARAVCHYGMLELMLPKQQRREPMSAPRRRRKAAC